MVWLQVDYLLFIWCRGLLLTGATAFSSQSPAPSPQPSGPSPPNHPSEPWYCPEPWTPECMLQHPNPTFRQLLEDLFLPESGTLTIPSRRFEAFYKMSQPVPYAIGLMRWGPIQRLWQMGCLWGLPSPPQVPLSPPPPPLLLLLHQSLLEVLEVWRKGKWMRHAWQRNWTIYKVE